MIVHSDIILKGFQKLDRLKYPLFHKIGSFKYTLLSTKCPLLVSCDKHFTQHVWLHL